MSGLFGPLVSPDMLSCEGKQSQMPCSLDCNGQTALVLGARTRLPPGFDLALFRQKPAERAKVLVVNLL